MSFKTWNGATASITTAADWQPSGMPGPGDTGIVSSGAVLADNMTLDGFTLRLAGNGIGVAPTLELTNTTLGAGMRVAAQYGASGGTAPTAAINVNGTDTNAGQIIAGTPATSASLQILLGGRTAELVNTGQITAEPGSTIGITAGQVVDAGRIVADGGAFVLNTQLTGDGTVLIEHGGAVEAQQIVGSGQTVLMHGGTLTLDSPNNFLAVLQGWDSGTQLVLRHANLTSIDMSGSTLELHDGGFLEGQIRLAGHYATGDFSFANRSDGSVAITTSHTGAFS